MCRHPSAAAQIGCHVVYHLFHEVVVELFGHCAQCRCDGAKEFLHFDKQMFQNMLIRFVMRINDD